MLDTFQLHILFELIDLLLERSSPDQHHHKNSEQLRLDRFLLHMLFDWIDPMLEHNIRQWIQGSPLSE